jgi:hypothetical protein
MNRITRTPGKLIRIKEIYKDKYFFIAVQEFTRKSSFDKESFVSNGFS